MHPFVLSQYTVGGLRITRRVVRSYNMQRCIVFLGVARKNPKNDSKLFLNQIAQTQSHICPKPQQDLPHDDDAVYTDTGIAVSQQQDDALEIAIILWSNWLIDGPIISYGLTSYLQTTALTVTSGSKESLPGLAAM